MPLFTPETARQNQAKAVASRIASKYTEPDPAPTPQAQPQVTDGYISRRLSRVREQIDRLSDKLDEEDEPQKLDRITAAIERLSKLEQTLAGRPLPGSLRPVERSSKRGLGGFDALNCGVNTPTGSVQQQPPKPGTPQSSEPTQ